MQLILVGATGLVGRHVLALALADARVESVLAPTRTPLPAHARLHAPTVDFDDLPQAPGWWRADAAVCALGTTMRVAGSRQAFRRVDHDYPLAIARLVHRDGVPAFVLNSAKGAHPRAPFFYSRTKGELEQSLRAIGFDSLTFVRPGLIGGERAQARAGEQWAGRLLAALHPALPRGWRINPAAAIAAQLLEAAIARRPGVHLVESGALT